MLNTNLQGAYLSTQQTRLWTFLGESQVYRSVCALHFEGNLHAQLLEQSIHSLLEKNEILRTTFRHLAGMDRPMQVVAHSATVDICHMNLEHLPEVQQWEQVEVLYAAAQVEPFDLARDLPLRVSLLTLTTSTHILLLSLPAMCADAQTLLLIARELGQTYTAYARREVPACDPLQYIDVAAWQDDLLQEEDAEQHQTYWRNIDLAPLASYRVPLTRQDVWQIKRSTPFVPHLINLPLEKPVIAALDAYLQHYSVSSEAFLLACWHILLWRLTTTTAPTGVVCNGRHYEELSDALGLYSRVVPFHLNLEDKRSFQDVVVTVEQILQDVREEQSYFDWKQCWPSTSKTNAPYFPVTFAYEQWPACLAIADTRCFLHQFSSCTEPFILKLSAIARGTALQLQLYYDSVVMTEEQGQQLTSYLYTLLTSALAEPQKPAGMLPLLSAREQQCVLASAMGARERYPQQPVQRLFEEQVERTPAAIAVVCAEIQLTYEQLNAQANQLAHYLRARGVGPNILVGLFMERSALMIVAVLGVLKAGGAYVPLDPEQPAARLHYQLQDIWQGQAVQILITQSTAHKALPMHTGSVFCLDTDLDLLTQQEASNPPVLNEPGDRAYIIYTSGSTGTPKGVEICHRSLVNYGWSLCKRIAPESGRQFATVSTLAADLGNTVIFCSLFSGGCLHVLPYEIAVSGEAFARYAIQHPIDILKIVPSHLQALLATCSEQQRVLLPRTFLILGGEALPGSLLREIAMLGGTCNVMNHYGPTEATIGVLVNELGVLNPEQLQALPESTISLGRPIANTAVLILDRYQQLVPEGVAGELFISGAGLARGYLHQIEQTQERFFPFSAEGIPEMMLYRTGDLGYYDCTCKQVMFLGRADTQIKLRGYRIELAEIETMLQKHSAVRECAVILDKDSGTDPLLIVYLVSRVQGQDTRETVRSFLREQLPAYMIPSHWVILSALPLTRNGKIDRQLLLKKWREEHAHSFTSEEGQSARRVLAPRDELEFQLLLIWENIVATRPIGVLDNFFDIGGNSLSAVRLVSQIKKHTTFDITLAALFRAPTIAELAVLIRQRLPEQKHSAVVPLQPQGTRPPFFCVHPVGGTVFRYRHLASYMAPEQPFYGLQAPELTDDQATLHSMAELADYYITLIRHIQPQGPYCLGGWSSGGVIAFAMAERLRELGLEVALLVLLDSTVPGSFFAGGPARPAASFDDAAVARWLIGEKFIAQPARDLTELAPDELLSFVWEQAKTEQVILADIDFTQFRNLAYVTQRNLQLVRSYVPQVYHGKITLVRCRTSVLEPGDAEYPSASLDSIAQVKVSRTGGWEQLTTGEVEVHIVGGDHHNFVDQPYVQELAETLKQCLGRVYNATQNP